MIRHIVCFKLKDVSKKEEAKELLLSMRGRVPQVKELEAGTDFLGSARSYDVFLGVLLEDRDALEAYQKDPYHVGVVKNSCTRRRSRPCRWILNSDGRGKERTGDCLVSEISGFYEKSSRFSLLIGKM